MDVSDWKISSLAVRESSFSWSSPSSFSMVVPSISDFFAAFDLGAGIDESLPAFLQIGMSNYKSSSSRLKNKTILWNTFNRKSFIRLRISKRTFSCAELICTHAARSVSFPFSLARTFAKMNNLYLGTPITVNLFEWRLNKARKLMIERGLWSFLQLLFHFCNGYAAIFLENIYISRTSKRNILCSQLLTITASPFPADIQVMANSY